MRSHVLLHAVLLVTEYPYPIEVKDKLCKNCREWQIYVSYTMNLFLKKQRPAYFYVLKEVVLSFFIQCEFLAGVITSQTLPHAEEWGRIA